MAVLGSKGVGWKVSCGANSDGFDGSVGGGVDLRPVMLSQLPQHQEEQLRVRSNLCERTSPSWICGLAE
jgi:hypothetical protein